MQIGVQTCYSGNALTRSSWELIFKSLLSGLFVIQQSFNVKSHHLGTKNLPLVIRNSVLSGYVLSGYVLTSCHCITLLFPICVPLKKEKKKMFRIKLNAKQLQNSCLGVFLFKNVRVCFENLWSHMRTVCNVYNTSTLVLMYTSSVFGTTASFLNFM